MKLVITACAFFTIVLVQAQIPEIQKKECYEKSASRKGQKFVDWECGKVAAIVDCNEKLEVDEDRDLILTKGLGRPFSGTCETCHSNGILERRISFVNGKEHGVDTTYYASGCTMVTRNHIDGKENGKWFYYYDSTGREAWEMNFMAGQKHGKHIYYNKKGDTTLYENYSNGVLNGVKQTYHKSNGKIDKVINYKNGLMHGPYTAYNKDGIVIQKAMYKEGKKDGAWTYYYEDGKLLRNETWSMDSRNGEFKSFYYQGHVQTIENYKKANGKPLQYVSADIYTCTSKQVLEEIMKMLSEKKNASQITEKLGNDITHLAVQQSPAADVKELKGFKLVKGINNPMQFKKTYTAVFVSSLETLTKMEIKDGWFEERYPDQKIKRQALYKKDVLVEEHIFDEFGKETYTYGGTSSKGKEDDEMPTQKGKKKKGKK
jgi:antitoxin component YwqK of YwqJK toxin-antitoxin module